MGEAGRHLIGLNLEGQRLWGLPNRQAFDGGEMVLATDGNTLWVGNNGNETTIYRVNVATGKYAPWKRTARDAEGREFQVLDLQVGALPGLITDPASKDGKKTKRAPTNMKGIALGKDGLAVALVQENKIQILDPETGDVRKEIAVPAPMALVWGKDDKLVVLTEGKLVKLEADGKTTPFLTGSADASYPKGFGLAVDDAGNIYLSDRGPDMNVKMFSPTGELVREIGRKGGRTINGPYDQDAMHMPGRISIDSTNRLWVPEASHNPKRTSAWYTATGKLVKDMPGTTSYAGAGSINPEDPTMAFSDDTVYKINLATGEWKPVYSVGRNPDPNAIFVCDVGSRAQFMTRNGITYVFTSDRTGSTVCTILKDGKWQPAAAIGRVLKKNDNENALNFEHPFMAAHVDEAYTWSDKNGDGVVQEDELSFAGQRNLMGGYWGILPGKEGEMSYIQQPETPKKIKPKAKDASKDTAKAPAPATAETEEKETGPALVRYPVKSYTASGAPVYDLANPVITP
ncbi:MAG TPA: hypothetical protein VK968_10270, partial [Roseimicrobium sp.]|nr:hypothetical protein [Roseimicrobium sp.]